MTTVLYVLIAAIIGFAYGRFSARALNFFQNRGEALLSGSIRENFAAPDFHLMNSVTLPVPDGTTQVDHILVSKYGVFVIETMDYKGWIFANPKSPTWTQVIFNGKFSFQNPIHQNFKHVQAVQSLLDILSPEAVISVVVFTGEAEFKTPIPDGVFTLTSFLSYLRSRTKEQLSVNRMQFCVGRLEANRLALTRETDIEHVQNLHRRHGNAA